MATSITGVVLDACVLVPAALRDTLLRAAERGLYRLYWSEEILNEVRRTLIRQRLTDAERAARLINQLRAAFPGSPVEDVSELTPLMTNHPKDRHVLAAAVQARAQIIVTHNLADFAPAALQPFGVTAESPDQFLRHLLDVAPGVMAQIMVEQTADKRRPSSSTKETLAALSTDAPEFARHVGLLHGVVLTHHPDEQREPANALGFFATRENAQAAAEEHWWDVYHRQSVSLGDWIWQQDGPIGPRWETNVGAVRYTIVSFPIE